MAHGAIISICDKRERERERGSVLGHDLPGREREKEREREREREKCVFFGFTCMVVFGIA